MKKINFIKTVPSSKHNEIRLWIWLCLIIGCALISNIIIISGMQWHLYRSLYKQKQLLSEQVAQFSTIMADHRQQIKEQQQLQKKLDVINRYKSNPKNPLSILSILRKATHDMSLQSVSITPKQFECNVLGSSTTKASACIKRLNQEAPFTNIQLVSLQTQNEKIQCILKGNVITKLRDIP
jgi:hypothetical protein